VALEALAAGCPLIVSDIGGLPELVEGGSGVVTRRGDPVDLAAKINLLLLDDDACARASQHATALAGQWLTPEHHLRSLESMYENLIEDRRDAS
jgi:glycosyltransferase involved in cell wall biosynthesis